MNPRVWNKKNLRDLPEGSEAVYVGRPSIWGNPFVMGVHGTRDVVVDTYEKYLAADKRLQRRLPELRGKHLICHCAPERCHADVLLRLANKTEEQS